MKLKIKIDIPNILIDLFKVGTAEDREAIADYICDAIYDFIREEVKNGKD